MNPIRSHRSLTVAALMLITALIVVALLSLQSPTFARAATARHVTKLADTNDGICNADCSLREAISAAASGDTITFDVTGTIVLSLGELTISTPLTIAGPGAAQLIINGHSATRIFNLNANTAISGVTIFNANATGGPGGGILINSGAITLTHSTILSNTANGDGGGIYLSSGSLFITGSLLSANAAAAFSGSGNGLYIKAAAASIVNSALLSNTSDGGYNPGGAVYNDGGALTVSGSTFSGNNAYYSVGGAIDNDSGALTIDNSTFITNTAANGGAIFNLGVMTVTNSSFISNTGTYNTAAIGNDAAASLSGVTIRGNTAGTLTNGWGGGIRNSGTLAISDSTINGNTALGQPASGGGIYNTGQLTLTNSTISDNTANGTGSQGGGIYSVMTSTVNLNFVTIAHNSAGTGGGGGLVANNSGGFSTGPATINFKNTIVAGNTTSGSGPDCTALAGGTLKAQDYNLIQNTSGCTLTGLNGTDLTTQDPKLSPLQKNGGSTQTRGLFVSSPAINQIPNATNGCGTTITADQRGVARPVNGACDIGAFEGTLYPIYLPLVLK